MVNPLRFYHAKKIACIRLISPGSAKRLYSLRAHHLGSLIFQAFRKKTPRSDQGSFNFAKSNHFKHLQNQHPRKIDAHKKCDTKYDASVMQFRKYSHHFSPKVRLWLRKNVFYYIVELPRVDGNRRYKRISLHTNNYYEARERIVYCTSYY